MQGEEHIDTGLLLKPKLKYITMNYTPLSLCALS